MGFFDSIKKAFHHPVDVNIKNELQFDYQVTAVPLQLELINKDKQQDLTITTITVEIERYQQRDNNGAPEYTNKETVNKVEQAATIILPVTGQPTYLNISVPCSISQVLTDGLQAAMPDNAVANGLASLAGSLEKAGHILNMNNNYAYKINVNVLDSEGNIIGYDNKPAYFVHPGEIRATKTFFGN